MRKCATLTVATLLTTICFAQLKDPLQWNFTSRKIDTTTLEIHLTASIENGWHIYSQHIEEGGPFPTIVSFANNPFILIRGKVREEGLLEKHYDTLFKIIVSWFSDKIDFVQLVELKAKVITNISGSVEFMASNDHECLPPVSEEFSIPIQ